MAFLVASWHLLTLSDSWWKMAREQFFPMARKNIGYFLWWWNPMNEARQTKRAFARPCEQEMGIPRLSGNAHPRMYPSTGEKIWTRNQCPRHCRCFAVDMLHMLSVLQRPRIHYSTRNLQFFAFGSGLEQYFQSDCSFSLIAVHNMFCFIFPSHHIASVHASWVTSGWLRHLTF